MAVAALNEEREMCSLTRLWRMHVFPATSSAPASPPGRLSRLALALAVAGMAAGAGLTPTGAAQAQGQTPAQTAPAQSDAQEEAARSLQWPRSFEAADGTRVELYQPQIDTWTADRITGRMAVAVGAAKGNPTYGVADFSARAEVNKPAGLVHLSDIRIERVQVPTSPEAAAKLRSQLEARLPAKGVVTRLDALQLSYTLSQNNPSTKTVPVDNAPPRIIYRTVPTVLVLIDG